MGDAFGVRGNKLRIGIEIDCYAPAHRESLCSSLALFHVYFVEGLRPCLREK